MMKARKNGIRTPSIMSVDLAEGKFIMEYIHAPTMKQTIVESMSNDLMCELGGLVGTMLAKLHNLDIVHGDLTTSNILIKDGEPVLIDFGLGYGSNLVEDKAVDLYVLERAIGSTHPDEADILFNSILDAYRKHVNNCKNILNKLADVQLRGRKREMIG